MFCLVQTSINLKCIILYIAVQQKFTFLPDGFLQKDIQTNIPNYREVLPGKKYVKDLNKSINLGH